MGYLLRVGSLQLELQLGESARSSLLQLIATYCSLNTALQLNPSLATAWGPSMLCAVLQLGGLGLPPDQLTKT